MKSFDILKLASELTPGHAAVIVIHADGSGRINFDAIDRVHHELYKFPSPDRMVQFGRDSAAVTVNTEIERITRKPRTVPSIAE